MKKGRILLAFVALFVLTFCTAQADGIPELLEPVGVKLDTAAVVRQDIYRINFYDSSVVPYVESLCFTVDGEIEKVHVFPGQQVKKGDVLVTLDQEALEKQAQQLERELKYSQKDNAYQNDIDRLKIERMRVQLARLKSVGGETSVVDIQLMQEDIKIAEAALRQSMEIQALDISARQTKLHELQQKLTENELIAPFDGRIAGDVTIQDGGWIRAYDPILFLADDTRLSLDGAYISENTLAVANRLYALIGDKKYDITLLPMNKKEYITAILAGTTLTSRFRIDGPEEYLSTLESGQYASIQLLTGYVEDALVIPGNALYRDTLTRYVYVIQDGSRIRRDVKVGVITDSIVEITEGLEEGEEVYVKD